MMNWFATVPWPFALTSTAVSVEKLSTPDPGVPAPPGWPPPIVPNPDTPGAIVASEM